MSTPITTAWPTDAVYRYLNLAGATIDVLQVPGTVPATALCGGCDWTTNHPQGPVWALRESAQRHADKCRALPRPASA
ncbi:hypothetical protein [Streptomyces sp. NPDC006879]|uniref:hypothetical protein n=1 Tax=Streptomyces sp. NPDC006879 TaxID=3364767 RepID=UPI00368424C8